MTEQQLAEHKARGMSPAERQRLINEDAEPFEILAAMSNDELGRQIENAKKKREFWVDRESMLTFEANKRMRADDAIVLPIKGKKQLVASTTLRWDDSRYDELKEYLTPAEWGELYTEAHTKEVKVPAKMDTRKLATWARQRGGDFAEAVDAIRYRVYNTVKVEHRR